MTFSRLIRCTREGGRRRSHAGRRRRRRRGGGRQRVGLVRGGGGGVWAGCRRRRRRGEGKRRVGRSEEEEAVGGWEEAWASSPGHHTQVFVVHKTFPNIGITYGIM